MAFINTGCFEYLMRGSGKIRVEVEEKTLLRLLMSQQLCTNDFRCLDCDSKQCVRKLFLMSCARNIDPDSELPDMCVQCGHSDSTNQELSLDYLKNNVARLNKPVYINK